MPFPSANPVDVEGVMEGIIPLFVTRLLHLFHLKSHTGTTPPSDIFLGANDFQTTLYSTVLAKVNGVQTRIMLESRAGSSYISGNLLTKLNIKPYRTESRVIEQICGKVHKGVDIYKVHVESNVIDSFGMQLQCVNAEKPVLIFLPTPRISELKQQNRRIRRLIFNEEQATRDKLLVRIILGAADIQQIK